MAKIERYGKEKKLVYLVGVPRGKVRRILPNPVAGGRSRWDNLGMAGSDYLCPHCGAELRGDPRKGGSRPGGTPGCPYDGLAYAALRAGHDAIYFGAWRRIDAPPLEIRRGYHAIGRHLDAIGREPAGQHLVGVVGFGAGGNDGAEPPFGRIPAEKGREVHPDVVEHIGKKLERAVAEADHHGFTGDAEVACQGDRLINVSRLSVAQDQDLFSKFVWHGMFPAVGTVPHNSTIFGILGPDGRRSRRGPAAHVQNPLRKKKGLWKDHWSR
jgi:hypothetical protein